MGLNNDMMFSGLELTLPHADRVPGSVPVPTRRQHWTDELYGNKISGPDDAPSVWNPFAPLIYAMHPGIATQTPGTFNPLAPIIYATNPGLFTQKMQEVKGDQVLKQPGAQYAQNSINQVKQLLYNAGVPDQVIPWAAAQVIFETANFTSKVSKEDFNLSGIKWINKPYQKATKGRKAPEGGYYAHFPSYTAWAADFKRILGLGGNAGPLHATSLKDYVDRLYKNGYFKSSPGVYYAALQGILNMHDQATAAQKKEIQVAHDKYPDPKKKGIPWWGWGLIGVGGLVVLKKLLD